MSPPNPIPVDPTLYKLISDSVNLFINPLKTNVETEFILELNVPGQQPDTSDIKLQIQRHNLQKDQSQEKLLLVSEVINFDANNSSDKQTGVARVATTSFPDNPVSLAEAEKQLTDASYKEATKQISKWYCLEDCTVTASSTVIAYKVEGGLGIVTTKKITFTTAPNPINP